MIQTTRPVAAIRWPLYRSCGERSETALDTVILCLTWISGQWLAPNVGGTLDLDQHADAGVRADMRLLARQQQIEYGVTDGPAVVQFGLSVETQKARSRERHRAAP